VTVTRRTDKQTQSITEATNTITQRHISQISDAPLRVFNDIIIKPSQNNKGQNKIKVTTNYINYYILSLSASIYR